MADAIARARVVPSNVDQDLAVLVAALAAETLDTVVADPGNDLMASADITHSEAADADGVTSAAAITAAITAVGNCELVGDIDIEADPTLNAPADGTLDISDGNVLVRTYTPTLVGPDAKVASLAITTNEIPSGAVVISRGNPQGHEAQKSPDGSFDLTIGPAVAGDATGSPHDVTVEVTDSNGRTVTDTIAITVQA